MGAQVSTPRAANLPFFWRLLPFLEACWGPKNLQFPAATDKAGCWPKCGSRLTPCGQVILFRNSSRISLLMLFFFFNFWLYPPLPNPGSSLAKPSSSQQGPAFLNALESQGLRKGPLNPNSARSPPFFVFLFAFSPPFLFSVSPVQPVAAPPGSSAAQLSSWSRGHSRGS